MKYKNIFLLLLSVVIILNCNDNNITEPVNNNELVGTWTGKYNYSSPPWYQVTLDSGEIMNSGETAETDIVFTENSIKVFTKPIFIYDFVEEGSITRGLYADTLYEGNYRLNKDTLEISVEGITPQDNVYNQVSKSETHKFIYKIENENLSLELVVPSVNDSTAPVYYSTFLFGFSYNTKDCEFLKK